MTLIGGHISRLVDFRGRENRQPFWLWMLIVYAVQMVAGLVIGIALMSSMSARLAPLMTHDQAYLNEHPEVAQQIMAQAMQPMMRGLMTSWSVAMLFVMSLVAAAVVRRLHDGGRSGWWATPVFALQAAMLLLFVTIFPKFFEVFGAIRPNMSPQEAQAAMGPAMQSFGTMGLVSLVNSLATIILIVFLALPGTVGPNRFGPDPLGGVGGFPLGPPAPTWRG